MEIDIIETQNKTESNISKEDNYKLKEKTSYQSFIFKQEEMSSVSIFKVLFTLANRFEIFLFIIGCFGGIGHGITFQLIEYFTGDFIDYLNEDSLSNSIKKNINKLCIKMIFYGFLALIFGYLMMAFFLYFSKLISNKYKVEYFKNVLSMDQIWFDLSNKSSFDMSNQMVLELETIENGIGISLGNIIVEISSFIFGIVFAFIINWKFSLVLFAVFPFIFIIQYYISNLVNKESEKQRKINEKVGGYMEEILYKIKTVAAFVNFDFEENNYNKLLDQSLKIATRKAKKVSLSTSVVIFSINLMFSITFIIGGIFLYKHVKTNGKLITSGNIYSVLALISSSSSQLPELTQNIQLISNCTSGSKFFFNLYEFKKKLDKEKEKTQNLTKKKIIKIDRNEIKGSIKFKNVTFSYPKNKEPILKNFTLDIPMGKTTALVGSSGCGKSTIVKLIERIYNPKEGYILLDDKYDIKDLDLINYRDSIGYVAQEPVLFNDTIRNNLLFGRKIENEEETLKNAIEKAHISKFINNLNGKFEYIVGVKGGKLSGGQKQRIAIARALLNNPKILIFDEATSALDNKSEKQVQKSINSLQGQVTIIIIAHRLSTVEKADNIIFLGKQGEILERGTHQELMNLKGKYYELYNQGTINSTYKMNSQKSSFRNSSYIENNNSALSLGRKSSIENIIDDNKLSMSEGIKKLFYPNNKNNYMKYFYIGCITSFLSGGLSIINGLIFGYGTNALTNKNVKKARDEGLKYGIILFITSMLSIIIEYIRFLDFSMFGEKLVNDFKVKIFHKYLSLHLSFFDLPSNSPGELVSQVNLKTSAINGVVLSLFSMIIECIGNFSFSTILGLIYEYKITLINLSFIPFVILLNYYSAVLTEEDENLKLNNKYGDVISENLSAVLTIFSFNAQENSINHCKNEVYKGSENYFKFSSLSGLFYGLTLLIAYLDYTAIYYSSGKFLLNKSTTISKIIKCYGIISSATFFIGMCVKNLKNISLMKKAISELIVRTQIKSEIDPFDESNELISKNENEFRGKIEFKNVNFSYPTNKKQMILKNFSFKINPGEKIGFMGKSGSGKSSIIQLIERFYDCDQGEILIDDINIKKYNIINLRKIISIVQQEPVLFSQLNIRENIKYGKLDSEENKIEYYGEIVNIIHKINENSSNELSGGEKQRVAIARALIKNAKILILDEATSALDNKSENEIQNMLDSIIEKEKITVIVIAHRLKAIQKCDKIYKIQNGEIIDSGTLEEIMNKENE